MKKYLAFFFLVFCIVQMSSCVVMPPKNTDNICSIFQQYPKWYWATQDTEKRWGVPIAVQMAIVHQESHFKAKAKPPRRRLLGFIPWFRPTSAYGYTQALNMTWNEYRKKAGKAHASRKNFHDAVDFIGWYAHRVHKKLGVSTSNAYAIYLAYHEGMGGYKSRTYKKKPWLMHVSKKVARRAKRYQAQLNRCRGRLKKRHFWNIWY